VSQGEQFAREQTSAYKQRVHINKKKKQEGLEAMLCPKGSSLRADRRALATVTCDGRCSFFFEKKTK